MSDNVKDLVDAIRDGDNQRATEIASNELQSRVVDQIDGYKGETLKNIWNDDE